jgi:hypothetical protein
LEYSENSDHKQVKEEREAVTEGVARITKLAAPMCCLFDNPLVGSKYLHKCGGISMVSVR